MTKGTKKSSSFNIMPQYGDDFVTQQGCDALCQAIEGEAAAAVKDIIAWTRSTEKSWPEGRASFGTKVVVTVGPDESTHQIVVRHALVFEPTRTNGDFTAPVSFDFKDQCPRH